MTRVQFSEILRLSLGVESQDFRASMDDRVLWRLGDMVRGELIFQYIGTTSSISEFSQGIVFPVKHDTVRNRNYIDVGGKVLSLPDNKAIVSVGLTQGDEEPFTLTEAGQLGIASGLECADIGTSYWEQGARIYFNNLGNEILEVLVIAIPSIDALSDDDDVPIPSGMESQWIDKTKAKLFPQQPEDKSVDTRQAT